MFLQVHFLTSYAASLLNRDDAGLAKRINFGGVPRLRVSSQCQKRHWREALASSVNLPAGMRTRYFFAREIKPRLIDGGVNAEFAVALVKHLATKLLVVSGDKKPLDEDTLMMKQPVLFGKPEADYMVALLSEAACEDSLDKAKAIIDDRLGKEKRNFQEMLRQCGLGDLSAGYEGALFGRFVTSDILTRVDAPVHVAHAITTHALDTEVDYFTVVDDLSNEDETGAAHANEMELGAGIFYGYSVVDIPLFVSNLTGCAPKSWLEQDHGDARLLLTKLLEVMAKVSPGAKLGATAPYARAEVVLLEVGQHQPRTLANAFLKPVRLGWQGQHPMSQSTESLSDYVTALDAMYGATATRRYVASLHGWRGSPSDVVCTFPDAIAQSIEAIFGESQV